MYLGETIRKIRIQKGFSQKETYNGIISKSYSISFEQNKHHLSIDLLVPILNRLSVDFDELLFIHRGYTLDEYGDYIYRYAKYANRHDIAGIQGLLVEFSRKEQTPITKVRCAELRARLAILKHLEETNEYNPKIVNKDDAQIVKEYLRNTETWTLQEVHLYGNTIEWIDADLQFTFFRRLSRTVEYYTAYDRGRDIYCGMLVNLIAHTLKINELDIAEVLIRQLELLAVEYPQLFHRMSAKFFAGILTMKKENLTAIPDSAAWIIEALIHLDQIALAKELKALIQ
ncbi:MAG: Rgg/GadR/MutR family transcriptional regulator [Enterococcus sp.]